MKFTPKSDKELNEDRLLPVGEYDFTISKGQDTVSKKGNEMIELLIRVFKPDGTFILVTDYLMESMLYKVSHAAQACGLADKYNAGNLLGDDFEGKSGRLKLGIQVDKEGNYPDRNVVKDYIVDKDHATSLKAQAPVSKVSALADLDDEIPF
ncbi:hypothetical protein K3G63_04590 [Hymenobacter sp. HSC-4F20]|uniref:hypothetical protein n=1 Tax=Hymenobacter sp. HSC-4F20 TaxID=2864135 RepID=UPI001C733054|nr:hypothetical protein [Hymenobacter sp. HSC-4F20]MBX0289701.1 hypothetical protein [Hymenobacter sp. HSC-4F20]